MTAERTTKAFGWRVYGLGIMALGVVCLALGDFHPGQPVPKDFPGRTVLAYAVAAFMLVAGAAVEWRRTLPWAAAAITAYFALVVVHPDERPRVACPLRGVPAVRKHCDTARDHGGRTDRLRKQREDRCSQGRTPHARGSNGVRALCAGIRHGAFCVHEPYRAAGPEVAAAVAGVLGVCDRHRATSRQALRS